MSANLISHHEAIPEINSQVFEGHEDSLLAVGIVAVGSQIMHGREAEFHGYGLLRGNVYSRQKGYQDVAVMPDGTEFDADDERAIHLAVFENATGATRVVASMRMIVKTPEHPEELPVEHHYPEAFASGTAPLGSVEISRWIARHEHPVTQSKLKWPLFSAAVSLIMEHGLSPTYGVVEPKIARSLGRAGVPVTHLSEPCLMPGVQDPKLAIQVDVAALAQNIEADHADASKAAANFQKDYIYSGTVPRVVPAAVSGNILVA